MSPVGLVSTFLPQGPSRTFVPARLVRGALIVGLILCVQHGFGLDPSHAYEGSAGDGDEKPTVRLPVDVDGDGDTDRVGVPEAAPRNLVWFERTNDRTSSKRHVIASVDTEAAQSEPWTIEVRDLGRDGDRDLIVGAPAAAEPLIYENVGADTGFRARALNPGSEKADGPADPSPQTVQGTDSSRTSSSSVVVPTGHASDCGTGQDAPDTFPGIDESNTTECFEARAGIGGLDQVNASDEADFYVFSASTGDNVSAVMDPSEGTCVDFDLFIYAANTTFSSINAGCEKESISFLVSSGGNFILEVDNFASDVSDYLLLECDGNCPPGGGGAGTAEECLIERTAPASWTSALRRLRDAVLLESAPGRRVTRTYYRWFGSGADLFG